MSPIIPRAQSKDKRRDKGQQSPSAKDQCVQEPKAARATVQNPGNKECPGRDYGD
jgi:hypothetical protein